MTELIRIWFYPKNIDTEPEKGIKILVLKSVPNNEVII